MKKHYAESEHEIHDFSVRDPWEANWKTLVAEDEAAKAAGTMLGRFVTHPIGDGRAVYQIIGESQRTVRILVCTGLGDDWTIPAWGYEASVPKTKIAQMLARRDATAALSSGVSP